MYAVLKRMEGPFRTVSEYPRIKKEHIWYMIPRKLRKNIEKLYDDTAKEYDKRLMEIGSKYRKNIEQELLRSLHAQTSTTNASLSFLCGSAFWLPSGKVPEQSEAEFERSFQEIKNLSENSAHSTWQEFFDYWKVRFQSDKDYERLVAIRNDALLQIQHIKSEVGRDLDAQT